MSTEILTFEKDTILENEQAVLEAWDNGTLFLPFPGSDFVEVNDGRQVPLNYIGRLAITMSSGATGHGTGTLIGRKWVLTAAHNVKNGTYGHATAVTFTPGQTRNASPFGTFTVVRAIFPAAYGELNPPAPGDDVVDYTQYLYDYAVLELDRDVFAENTLLPYVATRAQLNDRLVNTIIGYPGHAPAGSMWYAVGNLQPLVALDEPFLFYKTSTNPGDSGAGVTMELAGHRRIVGIHIAGSPPDELDTNIAVRITQEVYDNIVAWMQ